MTALYQLNPWQISAICFALSHNEEFGKKFSPKLNLDTEVSLSSTGKGFFIEFSYPPIAAGVDDMAIDNTAVDLWIGDEKFPVGLIAFVKSQRIEMIEFHSYMGEIDWDAVDKFYVRPR